MEAQRRRNLEEVMRRLIEGEVAMVWALSTQFGSELGRVVCRHLRSMGRTDVISDAGRVEGLVLDVAFWFLDHGAAYDPASSLPWVWGDRPILALVGREVGHRSVELDSARAGANVCEIEPASTSPTIPASFEVIAAAEPTVRLLLEAVQSVGSERDAAVHLEYRTQCAFGDPSPSHTVADLCGLQAANVRQIDRRMRKKVLQLATTDRRYVSLRELAWLA